MPPTSMTQCIMLGQSTSALPPAGNVTAASRVPRWNDVRTSLSPPPRGVSRVSGFRSPIARRSLSPCGIHPCSALPVSQLSSLLSLAHTEWSEMPSPEQLEPSAAPWMSPRMSQSPCCCHLSMNSAVRASSPQNQQCALPALRSYAHITPADKYSLTVVDKARLGVEHSGQSIVTPLMSLSPLACCPSISTPSRPYSPRCPPGTAHDVRSTTQSVHATPWSPRVVCSERPQIAQVGPVFRGRLSQSPPRRIVHASTHAAHLRPQAACAAEPSFLSGHLHRSDFLSTKPRQAKCGRSSSPSVRSSTPLWAAMPWHNNENLREQEPLQSPPEEDSKHEVRQMIEGTTNVVVQLAEVLQNVASDVNALRGEQKSLEKILELRFESLVHSSPQLAIALQNAAADAEALRMEPGLKQVPSLGLESLRPPTTLQSCAERSCVASSGGDNASHADSVDGCYNCSSAAPARSKSDIELPENIFDELASSKASSGNADDTRESSDAPTDTAEVSRHVARFATTDITRDEGFVTTLREVLMRHEQDPHAACSHSVGANFWRKARRDLRCGQILQSLLQEVRKGRSGEEPHQSDSPRQCGLSVGAAGWSKLRRGVAASMRMEALLHEVRGRQLEDLYARDWNAIAMLCCIDLNRQDDTRADPRCLSEMTPRASSSRDRRRQLSKLSLQKTHQHLERQFVMPWGGTGVGTSNLVRNRVNAINQATSSIPRQFS